MERTLLRSRKSSSNCSRIEGVIRERMISERFSRLMRSRRREDVGAQPVPRHYSLRRCLNGNDAERRALAPAANGLNADLFVVLADVAGELGGPHGHLDGEG